MRLQNYFFSFVLLALGYDYYNGISEFEEGKNFYSNNKSDSENQNNLDTVVAQSADGFVSIGYKNNVPYIQNENNLIRAKDDMEFQASDSCYILDNRVWKKTSNGCVEEKK